MGRSVDRRGRGQHDLEPAQTNASAGHSQVRRAASPPGATVVRPYVSAVSTCARRAGRPAAGPIAAAEPRPVAREPIARRAVPQPPPSHAVHLARRHRLFGTKREIVRAVIASEVLGKPLAFRDE